MSLGIAGRSKGLSRVTTLNLDLSSRSDGGLGSLWDLIGVGAGVEEVDRHCDSELRIWSSRLGDLNNELNDIPAKMQVPAQHLHVTMSQTNKGPGCKKRPQRDSNP